MATQSQSPHTLIDQLESLQREAVDAAAKAADLKTLENVRVNYIGRNKGVNDVMSAMRDLSAEDRPQVGQAANRAKTAITEAIETKKAELEAADADRRASEDRIDLTLPGRKPPKGHMHPVAQTLDEIVEIFRELGFQVATGPDIETEWYNFDALNTPEDHPARDSHDTFYVKPGVVLRTHTSPVQMRVMEKHEPPVAIVAPGQVYRCDLDATHSPMFNQLEGLLVDEHVTFAELKGTLEHFVHAFFGPGVQMRFRPHFFPFTEPSAELDILWTSEDRQTGETKSRWLEILGCGMVHPNVLKNAGYDPEKVSGFAFGMGVDRIVMVRHQINSIQYIYENDLRFLEQF